MPGFTPNDYSAILLSLKVAGVATLLSLPFGFAVAYLMTFRKFRGRVALDVIVNLPLTLPPVVIGYLLLLLLGQQGCIGRMVLQPLGHQTDIYVEGSGDRNSGSGLPSYGEIDPDRHGTTIDRPAYSGLPNPRGRMVRHRHYRYRASGDTRNYRGFGAHVRPRAG